MTKKLRIIPLGGVGEIGKNMTVLEYGRNMIVVDCGVMFPESDMYGIDLVLPQFDYVVQNQDKLRGVEGLNNFFANPTVQEQAGEIFSQKDATVWAPAEGFYSYHLAAPYGKNDRIVAMVRGTVASRADAMALHNLIVASQMSVAHAAGDISHDVYFMVTPPGEPESLEFLAVDVWVNAEGMGKYYSNPDFQAGVLKLFTAAPTVSTWNQTMGEWVEW